MKWLFNYGLLLYIIFILLFGIYMAIFKSNVYLSPMVWTSLLAFYILLLSVYIQFGQRSVNFKKNEENEENS